MSEGACLHALERTSWSALQIKAQCGKFAASFSSRSLASTSPTETRAPSPETLKLMREVVAPQLAEVYPQFAAQVFGIGKTAFAR